jgi:hypothetical protein
MTSLVPPELVLFEGEWTLYEDEIYQCFVATVVRGRLTFENMPISVQYRPETNGKHFGFWHVISESENRHNHAEEDRIPDIKRCERIKWIAWLIKNYTADGVSWWKNKRKGKTHIVIWAEELDFAVILAERKGYYLLKTAYWVKPFRKRQFTKERDAWRKTQGV